MKEKLILIDGSSFCYRAFYALKNLSTSWGFPTGAIFGFSNMINKILDDFSPQYIGICFDVSKKTFRQEKFKEYKIHRPPTPDALQLQFPYIKRLIQALNIRIIEKEGFEADDLICSLVKKFSPNLLIIIVSNDKDVLQLIKNKEVIVYDPLKQKMIDENLIVKELGILPQSIPDYLALVGDTTDNIPKIPGIGNQTALRLLREFKNIENILNNLHRLNPVLKKIFWENKEKILLNKELAKLREDVELGLCIDDLKLNSPDLVKLYKIYSELEFKRLLERLPPLPVEKVNIRTEFLNKNEILLQKEIVFLLDNSNLEDVYILKEDTVYKTKIFEIKELLESDSVKKISYDLKTQSYLLSKKGIDLRGLYFDVELASYIDRPDRASFKLRDLVFDYLDKFIDDTYIESALYFISKLYLKLKEILKEKNQEELFYKIEMPLVKVLSKMESNGIKLDLERLKKLAKDLESESLKIIEKIYTLAGTHFNLNSPLQLRTLLFEKLKLPVIKKTKTGPSTDEEVLEKLSSQHPLPKLILEYRQLNKLKSTYVEPLLNFLDPSTHKIHACFNQTSTSTGRLSSSHPNLQNIPTSKTELGKRIRECFVSSFEEGFLMSADYSQIELRILAHLSGDENLIKAFLDDKDIHTYTASLVFKVEERDVTPILRDRAKRINFGIIYGMGPYSLSKELNVDLKSAEDFIKEYFSKYPKVKDFIDKILEELLQKNYVSTLLGRRRYIPQIKSKIPEVRNYAIRAARNFPIQGTAADIIKLAMIEIDKEMEKKKMQSKLCIQIHDELIFDVKKEELDDLKNIVKEKMERVIELKVPLKVEINVGRTWADLK